MSSMYFRYFVIIFHWKRTIPFIWTNLNPVHPRMHGAKFGWNKSRGSREKNIFLNFVDVFRNYVPFGKGGPFIWTNLKSLHPRMHCAKFGWNKPSGSGEDYLNFVDVFSLFRYHLPLEKDRVLHLKKFESTSPKDALCHVWLKLAQWFWTKRFINF